MKVTSADDYKLRSSFEAVRQVLLNDKYADRLENPLAYWALPDDRRLPLAFLGRTLQDLVNASFEELTTTSGIGRKKISSLVKLLHRAKEDDAPSVPFGIREFAAHGRDRPSGAAAGNGRFQPAFVSEALWTQWRETVRRHELGGEMLGRLAPSLKALPTVIWRTPLSAYLDQSLAQIRQLKTHGEKRVRVVLEVFCVAHEMLHGAGAHDGLAIRLSARFVPRIERWIAAAIRRDEPPGREEVRRALATPLLDQIWIDAGDAVFGLAAGRLGMDSSPESVHSQAKRMGVTRARVYQLLDACGKVMEVRWPEGRFHFSLLAAQFLAHGVSDAEETVLFRAIRELLFPEKPDESGSGSTR